MASNNDETVRMGSGASRLWWCSFCHVQTAPTSEDCGDDHNNDKSPRFSQSIYELPNDVTRRCERYSRMMESTTTVSQ